ncbi:restriction endonuclease [Streptomyces caniferus]|uniref:restriction endonuclease n=2 Tax=Streptomyces caniferus TaxID=285557 RepID=UPI0037152737
MVTPIRRAGRPTTRQAFSLRQLTVSFGMVVIVVIGVGLTLKKAVQGASAHPGSAVLVGVVVLTAVVGLVRWGRRRRAVRVAPAGGPAPVGFVAGAVEPLVEPEPDPEPEPWVEAEAEAEADDFTDMGAEAFEEAVARLCERDGCHDVRVVGGANDLGADVVAVAPDGRNVVLQCKRYGEGHKVGSQDLQRFGGTCFAVHGADVAAVVTTSDFTGPAAEYAEQCGILCFDHGALGGWADGTGPAPWEAPAPYESPAWWEASAP